MYDTIRLGNYRGIPVGVHWSLLIFALLAVVNLATGFVPVAVPGVSAGGAALAAVVGVVGLFASIVAHELGHALRARRHGVETQGITLWLLGGVARLRSEAPTPRAAAEIAIAGPAVSVGLGLAAAAAAVVSHVAGFGALSTTVLGYLAAVNVVLAVFNMVPALPLDGGRLYQAWLWGRTGDRHRATIRAARLGARLGLGLVLLGLIQVLFGGVGGLWLAVLGLFVRSAAKSEKRAAIRQLRRPAPPWWFVGPRQVIDATVVDDGVWRVSG